jgi:hypothetical protein
MEKRSNNDEHDQPPQDEATKNKVDKHLRDEKDTISEEDLKNINTDITPGTPDTKEPATPPPTADKNKTDDDDKPKKEMPSTWDIIDE